MGCCVSSRTKRGGRFLIDRFGFVDSFGNPRCEQGQGFSTAVSSEPLTKGQRFRCVLTHGSVGTEIGFVSRGFVMDDDHREQHLARMTIHSGDVDIGGSMSTSVSTLSGLKHFAQPTTKPAKGDTIELRVSDVEDGLVQIRLNGSEGCGGTGWRDFAGEHRLMPGLDLRVYLNLMQGTVLSGCEFLRATTEADAAVEEEEGVGGEGSGGVGQVYPLRGRRSKRPSINSSSHSSLSSPPRPSLASESETQSQDEHLLAPL